MWCAHSLTYEAIDGKGIEETAKAAKLHTKLVTLRNRKRRTKQQQQRASKKKIAADLMATCMKFISCTYNFTSLAINIKCKANKQRNNVDDDWIVAWAENDYNIRSTGIGIYYIVCFVCRFGWACAGTSVTPNCHLNWEIARLECRFHWQYFGRRHTLAPHTPNSRCFVRSHPHAIPIKMNS